MHKLYNIILVGICMISLCIGLTGCEESEESLLLLEPDSEAVTMEDNTDFISGEPSETVTEIVTTECETAEIYVFVCGQVQNPGVYCLKTGSRICDAIELAGGCLDTADICVVNQAEKLTDGVRIYIPAVGETVTETGAVEQENDGRIHLNRASREELMTLPGIGEAKADAILEYRETHGGFTTIDELMNIPGIKEGVFNNIQDYITVE